MSGVETELPTGITHHCASPGEDVRALAAALEENSTLTSLDLSWNEIGDKGATSMAAALEKNSTLTSLDLSENEIGHIGAASLAAALQKNSTLTSMSLRGNDIGDEGVASLAAALEKNYALEVLDCNLPGTIKEQVNQLLARNMARYRQWRRSVMGWMWASRHLHVRFPRDVALMIGKMIWKTRTIYKAP